MKSCLEWPFFEERHRRLAGELQAFEIPEQDASLEDACRSLVLKLGEAGLLRHCCVLEEGGRFDVRSLALSRDILARRDALARVKTRQVFGKALAEFQLTQARLADMAVAVDAAALLVYRAAWAKDKSNGRITREAAMAKLFATESAQQVIDSALQLFGGTGVVCGTAVERLYREIRTLRIYEGTSEIQKLVIAGAVLEGSR
jgi:alkylation response protein AidB-like acyl-CoA dehydrogenase